MTAHITSWSVGVDPDPGAGRVKGTFSLNDGVTAMTVTDPSGYTVTGSCVIPVSGLDANGENYRFFVGTDMDATPGSGGGQIPVAGIRWSTTNNQWELSSDSDALMGASTPIAVSPGDIFQTRSTKGADGSIFCEYQVNDGGWTAYAGAYGNPLAAGTLAIISADAGDDYPAWSIRGLWESIGPIVISGADIPDQTRPVITLTGAAAMEWSQGVTWVDPGYAATDETDGDLTGSILLGGDAVNTDVADTYTITYGGVTDAAGNVALQVTREVTVMNDTDDDGLDDSWEILYFGDLDEGPDDDPDNDRQSNLVELQNGTDPTDETSRLPVAGVLALTLLAAAAGSLAVRRIRR